MGYSPVERLEQMSEEELREYVRSRLLGRISEPMVAWTHGELPEEFLVDAYALSEDHGFKSRLKQVVKHLLTGWRPGLNDDVQYGGRLIYLTGFLGVEGGDAILSRLADDPALEGLMVDDEPIKSLVLRTLLDFPGQEAREGYWEPLLETPSYFDTAFFALSLRSAAEGLRYLPHYLQMAFRTGLREGVLELRLANLVNRYFWPDRLTELQDALARLPGKEREKVMTILERAVPQAAEVMAQTKPVPVSLTNVIYLDQHIDQRVRQGEVRRALDLVLERDGRG